MHVVSQRARVLWTTQDLTIHSRFSVVAAFLPYRNGVGVLITTSFSKLNSPAPPIPLSTVQAAPRGVTCRTRGLDGFAVSFPVGLFHPLQHAGLRGVLRVARDSPGKIPYKAIGHCHIGSLSTVALAFCYSKLLQFGVFRLRLR